MADQLCEPEDVASLLQRDLDAYQTTMLIECGTAVVQAAAGGQRIVQVEDDTNTQMGTSDSWLLLPQWPVTDISDVEVDGEALVLDTDYKRFGGRLWRRCGWAECWPEPSTVTYTYTHGYPAGSQELQLGRAAVLGLIRGLFDNPTGVSREAIDDYSVAYEAMSAQMEASPNLQSSLRRQYGMRAGLVRIG